VARERGGHAVLAAERAAEPLEIDRAELDEIRAEPAAPHDLRAQRSVD
jgi:hypothetical protein